MFGKNALGLLALSNILQEFRDVFGNIGLSDEDKVKKQIAGLPDIVRKDKAYWNAIHTPTHKTQEQKEQDHNKVILAVMSSAIERYKAVQANDSFCKWVMNIVFNSINSIYPKPDNRPQI